MRSIVEQGWGLQRDLRFAVAMGALASATLLSGCVTNYQDFNQDSASNSKFETDKQHCRLQASDALDLADQQMERFEDGSDEEIIGAGLAAMLSGSDEQRKIYNRCMTEAGFEKR